MNLITPFFCRLKASFASTVEKAVFNPVYVFVFFVKIKWAYLFCCFIPRSSILFHRTTHLLYQYQAVFIIVAL